MRRSIITFVFLGLSVTIAAGQSTPSLSFQGRLTDPTGIAIDTPSVGMTFKIYRSGVAVWEEVHPSVAVTNGVFDVLLGMTTSLDTVTFNTNLELGITVGGDPEMTPRTPLNSAAYARALPALYTFYHETSQTRGYNVVGGAPNNVVDPGVTGATIGGGGGWLVTTSQADSVLGFWATVGGGAGNSAAGMYSTIGGGFHNRAQNNWSTIGGGSSNTASGQSATIGGGGGNVAGADGAFVGGGGANEASGFASVVGGGYLNKTGSLYSTVPGGMLNSALGQYSFAAGVGAKAKHEGTFVWNSEPNEEDSLQSTGPKQFLIRADGGVGIGTASPTSQLTVHGDLELDSTGSAIIFPDGSSQSTAATGGGAAWLLSGNAGTSPSMHYVGTSDSTAFELRANAHRVARFEPVYHVDAGHSPNIILGYPANSVMDVPGGGPVGVTISGGGASSNPNWASDNFGTIGGGFANVAGDQAFEGGSLNEAGVAATVSGGSNNQAGSSFSTVGGGFGNEALGYASVVAGGLLNKVAENSGTVCGGEGNQAGDFYSSVLGGGGNRALGLNSTVAGGIGNRAVGESSVVPGGQWNHARGDHSMAAGYNARAIHEGSFVWNDHSVTSGDDSLLSTAPNQFLVRAAGGVGIGTNKPGRDTLSLRPSGALLDVQQSAGRAAHFSNEDGDGLPGATLRVHNTSTSAGIAGWFVSEGTDASLIVQNHGSGDLLTAWAANNRRFRVSNSGEVYADGAFHPTGADVAEAVVAVGTASAYGPGDVMEISADTDRAVGLSSTAYSSRVAGVFATDPGIVLAKDAMEESQVVRVPVAVVGIVPTKVTVENGVIHRGDLLVTGTIPGHAMRGNPGQIAIGTLLGKAMQDFEGPGPGRIEVLLTIR